MTSDVDLVRENAELRAQIDVLHAERAEAQARDTWERGTACRT